MSAINSPSLQLVRTGRKVRFLDLHIGQAFFHQDVFWTRTNTYVGTDLRPRDGLQANSFGSCQFGRDDDTLVVEEVSPHFA